MIKKSYSASSALKSLVKNRKMKLAFVLNSEDGVKRVGCRAYGCHKGHPIERTAWCNFDDFTEMSHYLELLATGRYNREIREIDAKCS